MSNVGSSDTSLSPPYSSDIHSSDRRRSRSTGSSQSNALPKDVCLWKLKHADILNIKYDGTYLPAPLSVLEKTGSCADITPLQNEYLHLVKSYIQVEEFDFDIDLPFSKGCFSKPFKDAYKSIIGDIVEKASEEKTETQIETVVRVKVREFLFVVSRMLAAIGKKHATNDNIKDVTFCELHRAFADLCLLKAWSGKEDPCRIKNMLGVKHITSEPDFRLYKTGMSVLKPLQPEIVASVLEVKRSRETEKTEIVAPGKRKRISSSTSDTDEQLQANKLRSNIPGQDAGTDEELPAIRNRLSSNILGQHAGELFLDCALLVDFGVDDSLMKMPGMIFEETKLYYQGRHMDKVSKDYLQM